MQYAVVFAVPAMKPLVLLSLLDSMLRQSWPGIADYPIFAHVSQTYLEMQKTLHRTQLLFALTSALL